MQKTSTLSKKFIFKVDEFPPAKIMLQGSWSTPLEGNLPRLLDAWENETIHNMCISSIKLIKFCCFRSRIKKSGLMDWKEKLDKVSWNKRMGERNDMCN